MTEPTDTTSCQTNLNRVLWHSRRGMLELDIMLLPFAKEVFPELSPAEQSTYIHLLEHEDSELLSWFVNLEEPESPSLKEMILSIRTYAKQHTSASL